MPKKAINVPGAAPPGGPYSTVVKAGGFLFISGQGTIDPETGTQPECSFEDYVRLCMNNVKRLVEGAGATMDDIVKTTVFLADMDRFHDFNEVYTTFFEGDRPARSCIQAGRLPFDFPVEVEAIVYVGE